MGSGHILAYAFDLLMRIYERMGWTKRDAVRSIIEHNLYGLDIDRRAEQLAYFTVMMKACEYDSRFLTRRDEPPQPGVYAVSESNGISDSAVFYFADGRPELARDLRTVMEDMRDASEYGSILTPRRVDFDALYDRVDETYDEYSMERNEVWERILPMLRSADLLSRRYDAVVTNPPYMAVSNAGVKLQGYVKKNYPDSKSDLFAVFIERCGKMAEAYQAMITQQSWMFLSSFEKLREKLQAADIVNMAHLGAHAFDSIGGEVVQTTAFVLQKTRIDKYAGTYCRLIEPNTENGKRDMFLAGENRYTAKQSDFSKIPGSPVAYWVSKNMYKIFESQTIQDIEPPRFGMSTSDNNRFVRVWFEVSIDKFAHPAMRLIDVDTTKKWYPYNNGGEYRKWYGDNGDVVNWGHNGLEIKSFGKAAIRNKDYYYKTGITWTAISSAKISVRSFDYGFLFSSAGFCIFEEELKLYILALMNSIVGTDILRILSPTINFNVGDIARLPVKTSDRDTAIIEKITAENISLSRTDWDSFETSWDFQLHPLVRWSRQLFDATSIAAAMAHYYGGHPKARCPLELCFLLWQGECEERFQTLKANEEELNRIFIGIYGLQDELTPEVEDRDVTVRRADLGRDIRSLVSYAVGCMFGRYSLDAPGLAFAGGEWDSEKYRAFPADEDNCIPITDEEYFSDDIVARFTDFVRAAFGEETLEENLDYIARALGGRGETGREIIRNYFLNDFYADHLKVYQKRPIYWMFDSGRQNGFKALVYMHRWNADTAGNVRVEYLHKTQRAYERELERMQEIIDNSKVNREIVRAQRRRDKLTRQLKETRDYDQRLAHLALLRIDIDLDDGVKVNYNKVQTADGKNMEILAKIK